MSSSTTRSKKEQPFLVHVAESIGSTLGTMVAKAKVARKAANRSDVVRAAKREGQQIVRKSTKAVRKGARVARKSTKAARQTTRAAVAGFRKHKSPKATRHRGRVSRKRA